MKSWIINLEDNYSNNLVNDKYISITGIICFIGFIVYKVGFILINTTTEFGLTN